MHWWISGHVGHNQWAVFQVASDATTPDKITEIWRVRSRAYGQDNEWHDAPKIRARVCSTEEKRTAVERLKQERQQAMAQAQEVRSIMVEGQEQSDYQYYKPEIMSVYELMEGKEVGGRGVWQAVGGQDMFMYYTACKSLPPRSHGWFINNRTHMELASNEGWLNNVSTALTPDTVTETWRVMDISARWHDAQSVKVRAK
jgi:hypothetical protein